MLSESKKWFVGSIVAAFVLTLLIFILNPILSDVTLLPDKGSSWYYWKLSSINIPTIIVVWVLFLLHLLGNFFLIIKRIKIKEVGFHKYNLYLLLYNLLFIVFHFIETAFLYDGLAQTVPIWTSQYSVIFVLIILIIMQINNRGLFLGYKIPLPAKAYKFLYKTHGILFTVAIIYTFWYHPIVFTIGHITGFFYMFLLMIQISFVKNKVHYNKFWILLLEILVALHGASVAYFVQNSTLWSMFLFGFLFIFFMTQIYTLDINKYIKTSLQIGFGVLSVGYYLAYDIAKVHQILWIPFIEYSVALIILLTLFLIFKRK